MSFSVLFIASYLCNLLTKLVIVIIVIGTIYFHYVSLLVNHHQVNNQHVLDVSYGGFAIKILNILKIANFLNNILG